MKKTIVNTGKSIRTCISMLCVAVLPAFPVAITVAHAEDKTLGEKIDDTVITTKVKKDLMTDSQFKYGDVQVHTVKGTVVLSGFANSGEAKRHASDVAKAVEGVQDVKNDITLK